MKKKKKKRMTVEEFTRRHRVFPDGIPRWVRIYDNEGPSDRYTVVYTGNWKARVPGVFPYLSMSGAPFHPQGVCQHGESQDRPIDCRFGNWGGVTMGRKCHLGIRIPFTTLPKDCQTVVLQEYKELWRL